ncbi:50S ribosomal protein L18 [Arthrobacter crystallopoietes BAB-32]|uniref:50S ribosomal protein L18 n=1 Tax=Arthrobacter crystallopoietes BAB-32 TaxID=1246476 RepID=N1V5R9_9MICC|nr:50S ribosomal protein L18 [Arthrobacter crystallopoietes BAB-32]
MAIGIKGKSKSAARGRRHLRVRKRITGTAVRPRLVVNRSARHVFVQIVDDSKGITVASASTMEADLRGFDGDKTAKSKRVGELVAERAKQPVSRPLCSTVGATSTTAASLQWPTAHVKVGWHCDR